MTQLVRTLGGWQAMSRVAGAGRAPTPARTEKDKGFLFIFLACFSVFLVAALVMRLVPLAGQGPRQSGEGHKSIIGEARSLTDRFMPFVFMA